MDARKIGRKILIEAIEKKAYEFTGVTENGEVVLAILGDSEIKILNEILNKEISNKEKLMWIEEAIDVSGRNAQEYIQIYLQNIATKDTVCRANGLRLK